MAGRKISRANMQRIQAIADHAHAMGAKAPPADMSPIGKADSLGEQIEAVSRAVYQMGGAPMDSYTCVEEVYADHVIIEVCERGGDTYWRADYTTDTSGAVTLAARDAWVEVEEVWQPVTNAGKAGALALDGASIGAYATIKALAERHIEVKIAFGGPMGGRDAHGEFFSAKTDFDPEHFPAPPLLYYHGFDEHGRKMGRPAVTGTVVSRHTGTDGHYITYKLKSGKYADLQYSSAMKSACVVSPGTVGHLIRKASDGELLYWPLAEVSAWDYSDARKPANAYSVAAPVLKALYLAENLPIPETLNAPEAAGDAAASAADTTPLTDDQRRAMAAQIVADQLRTYRQETHR